MIRYCRLNENQIRIIPHDRKQPEYLASMTVDNIVRTASGEIGDYKFEFFIQEEGKNAVDVIAQVSDEDGHLATYVLHTNSVKKAEASLQTLWEKLNYEADRWVQHIMDKYMDGV